MVEKYNILIAAQRLATYSRNLSWRKHYCSWFSSRGGDSDIITVFSMLSMEWNYPKSLLTEYGHFEFFIYTKKYSLLQNDAR